jgi:hypothetical protein
MKFIYSFLLSKAKLSLMLIAGLLSQELFAQNINYNLQNRFYAASISGELFSESSADANENLKFNSLAFKPSKNHNWIKINLPENLMQSDFQTWESEKHFWAGVTEIAILEFIPWALAKWIRTWEDPADNWANVSSETWWRNISSGWEYDGDNFTTNNFAHPYHGALFFNAGRSNGYDFWESTAWSLTGSAVWEYFGETYRPAFNDWIYTGVGGANLVTDNTASGSDRVWSEIFGSLINPVRGFNRAISGEMGQNFPNPEWSRPEDFLISFDAGTRSIDKDGDKALTDKEVEGLFSFHLFYGNRYKARKPFDYFNFNFALASGLPHFTTMNSSGYLFGYDIQKNRHQFNVNLDFNYDNLIKEDISETDTTYEGFLFGTTQIYPHLVSRFPIGEKTNIVTQAGINAILMGATPNDYYVDVEGRVYDFGPGVGIRMIAAIQNGIWSYVSVYYYSAWLWTQSQPSDSKHHIHFLSFEAQYPFTAYFSAGIGAGIYWRNSYYENFPDVNKNHPIIKVFFKTALLDL